MYFYSFQISVYLNHFANKSNNQEICCSKTFISRVFKNIYCRVLSAANLTVVISMVERSHGFLRSSSSVCKSRFKSKVQCMTNGAENSSS